MTELKANRHYKDRVFRMIFNSREKLLELLQCHEWDGL